MTQRIEVTPELVRHLWAHMSREFGSSIIQKDDSKNMAAVAWALKTMGIMDAERFMRDFSTTLIDDIYIPFEIGDPTHTDLWSQIRLAGHEHQHVHQAKEEGTIVYTASYLGKKSGRAHWEADALLVDVELHFYQYGTLPDLHGISKKILSYGCGEAERRQIQGHLEMGAVTIEEGAVMTRAAQVAIKWLEARRAA